MKNYKAIGLFDPKDQGTWNDNTGNTAGPDVTVTNTPKPNQQDNTMLYIALAAVAAIFIFKN